MKSIPEFARSMTAETEKIIIGKEEKIELILTALLAQGHVLLDDLPGVGKTTLVKALSLASGCTAKRIQFVPDLLPSDITGMRIFNQKTGDFQLQPGPIFTNILLADEINRAVPRTQSALLESMEERSVSIDGQTLPLTEPFMVMATQNPVESESTFRLPAAQMDRFMIKLSMGYPNAAEERQMLYTLGDAMPFDRVETVSDPEEISALQQSLTRVQAAENVADYIVALTTATRSAAGVTMGASPRATRSLFKASKALAAIRGRDFITPDDVQYLAPFVLPHRMLLTSETRLSGKTADSVIQRILDETPVPPETDKLFHE